ncbi:MAG: hypothetical protein WAU04_08530, partial [Candidatus Nitrotoga sp.]
VSKGQDNVTHRTKSPAKRNEIARVIACTSAWVALQNREIAGVLDRMPPYMLKAWLEYWQ